MATTRARGLTGPAKVKQTAAPAEPAAPSLRLSAVGEYLRRVAEEDTPGAVQVTPYRHHGAPVLDETRIPVSYVLRELAAGRSWAEITAGHPAVTEGRIRAALQFAAAVFWRPQAEDVD